MENAIAVIGVDCRFPGAENKEEFWELLKNGKDAINGTESIRRVEKSGEFVNKTAMVPDIDKFDADFFNINPKDARYMDPQQRIFLESAWKVVEDAGYNVETMNRYVGVFAGCGLSSYLICNVIPYMKEKNLDYAKYMASIMHGNSGDYLTSRVAYSMNLKGPAITVSTACSSALTAVHLACRSLLLFECDMAISGGVSINVMQDSGYKYKKGEIFSKSGKCAPFSEESDGTVFGGGVGTVLLKRYEDAIEDQDYIYAVIRGSAINNDGADKVSYMSPSVSGQEEVIRDAITESGVDIRSISYLEAHGTGTDIGDAIEITALKNVFPSDMKKCGLGSVKGNIGHAIAASGIAGMIKVILSLERGYLCPSIHCEQENKKLNLKTSPFSVVKSYQKWEPECGTKRACVSSFGMGGSNAHAVLEEYKKDGSSFYEEAESLEMYYLKLSAKSVTSLERMQKELLDFVSNNKINLKELVRAYANRSAFQYRRLFYFRSIEELKTILKEGKDTIEEMIIKKQIYIDKELLADKKVREILEANKRNNFFQVAQEEIEEGNETVVIKKEEALAAVIQCFWESGMDVKTPEFQEEANKVPVPSYCFDRESYWLAPGSELIKEEVSLSEEVDVGNIFNYVAEKWKNYLGLEDINPASNFFEIGGHSLMAIQIIGEIEEELGIEVQIEKILENPTLNSMAELIKKVLGVKNE